MAPASSAVLGSQDERLTRYDEELEQASCRFEDCSGRAFWHLLCSRRTTPSGSHRGSVNCGGASGSVPRRRDGGLLAGLVSGSTVGTWSASALRCFRTISPHFHVKVYSDPEVASAHSIDVASVALLMGVLFMAQCLVQQWIHVTRQVLVLLEGFLREEDLEP